MDILLIEVNLEHVLFLCHKKIETMFSIEVFFLIFLQIVFNCFVIEKKIRVLFLLLCYFSGVLVKKYFLNENNRNLDSIYKRSGFSSNLFVKKVYAN